MSVPTTDKVFLETLNKLAPQAAAALGTNAPGSLIFSNTVVPLSQTNWTIVRNFIAQTYNLSKTDTYKDYVSIKHPELKQMSCKNQSVMMSYDFHITNAGPKLIEINTNAALSSYSAVLTESRFTSRGQEALAKLVDSFRSEADSVGVDLRDGILIVDEHPENQKAYGEFLIFRELFIHQGWPCEICDIKNLSYDSSQNLWVTPNGFKAKSVYNRWNDFVFKEPTSAELKKGWSAGLLVTPQPIEYLLLADKQRIIDWRSEEFASQMKLTVDQIQLIEAVVPKTVPIKLFNRAASRPERSQWFFKPRNSYGSRGVYEGSKISNKVFENILLEDYLAQEVVPPSLIEVEINDTKKMFKWDLRVYVYRDQIILPIARLYIGQTTNSQTLGGGLAPIQISSE